VASAEGEKARVDEAQLLGRRLREVRSWRQLNLREAADLAALSFSFWGQVERGEKPVATRRTLEAMAGALRVHPTELTGQPWAPRDAVGAEAQAGLLAIEIALERYELGVDPEVPVRPWPQIQPISIGWCICATMSWTTRCRVSWRRRCSGSFRVPMCGCRSGAGRRCTD
jgi:transcriptional regulator with XRE-family HTH domain